MKVIGKLKLNQISKFDLESRSMNFLRGGCCGCGCHYANNGGGSSIGANGNSNIVGDLTSYGGDQACWHAGVWYSTC